ncbi:rho guanine nucleotide exchange factor 10-like protein [Physella acuta]|uniref:rho guanine nucleotide exchange factor 10-like protein n=1 Tax=Physella acuta TaxID=109671 RepID=UPI0027DE160B|nr:rho guanine nucleotide exchange factor 10-like protein [Physella acuta]
MSVTNPESDITIETNDDEACPVDNPPSESGALKPSHEDSVFTGCDDSEVLINSNNADPEEAKSKERKMSKDEKSPNSVKKKNSFTRSIGNVFNKGKNRFFEGNKNKNLDKRSKVTSSSSLNCDENGPEDDCDGNTSKSTLDQSSDQSVSQDDSSTNNLESDKELPDATTDDLIYDTVCDLVKHEGQGTAPVSCSTPDPSAVQLRKSKKSSHRTDSLRSSVSLLSLGNRGCQEGTGSPVPVDFINPSHSGVIPKGENSEYHKNFLKSTESQLSDNDIQILKARGFDVDKTHSDPNIPPEDQLDDSEASCDEADLSFDWGSEFDDEDESSVQEGDSAGAVEAPEKPLPPKPGKSKTSSGLPFLSRSNKTAQPDVSSDDDPGSTACLPVIINPDKHPPPALPAEPEGLTENQKKRRIIMDLIIKSEGSYLATLERVLQEYEKPVLEYIHNSKSRLKPVFGAMKAIINHHKMFQIELSESVKKWDEEEKIGDIFTASFSKTMLVNEYSTYVNNFAAAMDEIRTLRRSRANFDEFLQSREKQGIDRLSIFGMMVKPVQRFPQFIMFLQDLIKYTPQNHHDRRALQLALTELENVAYKLNERKRQSEQHFQAQQTIKLLIKQKVQHMLTSWNLNPDPKRRFLRSDMVDQIYGDVANMKCKTRRIILMNDILLCVKVIEKEQAGFLMERLALRWMANVRDLELKDTAITPDMLSVIKSDADKIDIISSRMERPEEDPFHLFGDLHEMLHDYTVFGQISGLLASLKRSYTGHGLNDDLINEILCDLQRMIQIKDEQLRLVNSCSIVLEDTSKSDKPQYIIQTQTAAIKQDWCIDFLMAKLALDKSNSPAWDGSANSDDSNYDTIPAQFMKHLPVDIPRSYTKVKCAVAVFLNQENSPFSVGIQHMWVCSSSEKLGQISVISVHNSKPALVESFKSLLYLCTTLNLGLLSLLSEYLCLVCPSEMLTQISVISVHHSKPGLVESFNEYLCHVCPSEMLTQISVISVHNSKPVLVESFKACKCEITAAELVPGYGTMTKPDAHIFVEDTVWIATADNEIIIFPLIGTDGVHRNSISVIKSPSLIISLKFVDERLFCALDNGCLAVYSRTSAGAWDIHSPKNLTLGTCPVKIHFIHEEDIYLSCGNQLFLLEIDSLQQKSQHAVLGDEQKPIEIVVKSGVGIWVSFKDSSVIKLFHIETMESIQELSVGNFVNRIRNEKLWSLSGATDNMIVTSLALSKGLLWIGTSSGIVLTVPLPRLSDGVPLYRGRPSVSLHAHKGPVKFLIPLQCSASTLELTRASSLKSTIKSRPSRRKLERSQSEMGELEKVVEMDEGQQATDLKYRTLESGTSTLRQYGTLPPLTDQQAEEILAWEESSDLSKSEPDTNGLDENKHSFKNQNSRRKKSSDDSAPVLKRSSRRITEADRKSRTLSFRSELAERIVQSDNPSVDLDSHEPREVEMLYEVLLEDHIGRNENMDESNTTDSSTVGEDNLGINLGISAQNSSADSSNSSFLTAPSPSHKSNDQLSSSPVSSSTNAKILKGEHNSSSPGSPKKTNFTKSLVRGGALRQTIARKASSNAMIILSGGDGYCDLDYSRSQAKCDGACVMLWIYKF